MGRGHNTLAQEVAGWEELAVNLTRAKYDTAGTRENNVVLLPRFYRPNAFGMPYISCRLAVSEQWKRIRDLFNIQSI